jgi:hypothetical protein
MEERNIEIIGLHSSDNGRSCCTHSCCGDHLKVGDLLRLVKCVVTIDDEIEEAIKCVRIEDGTDMCTVGFLPRSRLRCEKIVSQIGGFAQVLEIYDESESPQKRRKSYSNKGMAACIFLTSIPQAE